MKSFLAFTVIHHPHQESILFTVPKLNDVDLMAIENVAELCLDAENAIQDECDLDQHDALVNRLQAQRDLMLDQVGYINDLLHRLQGNAGALAP